MAEEGMGWIVCMQCNADLGPSSDPTEPSQGDLCAQCFEARMKAVADPGRVDVAKDPELRLTFPPDFFLTPVHDPRDEQIRILRAEIADLRKRLDLLEKWADRQE